MELDDWLSQIVAKKENILSLYETLDTLYKFTKKDFFHLDELSIRLCPLATGPDKVQAEYNRHVL